MHTVFTHTDLTLMLELTTEKLTRIDAKMKKAQPGSDEAQIAWIDRVRVQALKDKISDIILIQ